MIENLMGTKGKMRILDLTECFA